MAGLVDPGNNTGNENKLFGLHLPLEAFGQAVDNDLPQPGHTPAPGEQTVWIAEYPVLYPLAQRSNNGLRGDEIHIRHPHWQDVSIVGAPLNAVRIAARGELVERIFHRTVSCFNVLYQQNIIQRYQDSG
jgi:hypothetical protein